MIENKPNGLDLAFQNRVYCTRDVSFLNCFENVLINEIVWKSVLFWRKKTHLRHFFFFLITNKITSNVCFILRAHSSSSVLYIVCEKMNVSVRLTLLCISMCVWYFNITFLFIRLTNSCAKLVASVNCSWAKTHTHVYQDIKWTNFDATHTCIIPDTINHYKQTQTNPLKQKQIQPIHVPSKP